MRTTMVAIAFLALVRIGGVALGDGAPLVPSRLLRVFSEQSQLAVVEVRADRTVSVDLFISLMDTSRESHEVPFLLPLQTMPDEFTVSEMTLKQFRDRHLQPLHDIMDRAQRADSPEAAKNMLGICALACNPMAVILASPILMPVYAGARGRAGHLMAPAPALSVETKHARAEVYPALKSDELAALARAPDLPATVSQGLKAYVGRPFALIRLRTMPGPNATDDAYWRAPSDAQPGLHFRFTQDMLADGGAHVYDSPLGTGKAWELPIKDTQVYVTAPEDFRLAITFPRGYRFKLARGIDGRQVHAASYRQMRPDQDVRIRLRGRGATAFTRARWTRPLRSGLTWAGFPLLAILSWVLAVAAIRWRDPSLKAMGRWALFWRSWLWAQGVALLVLSPVIAFLVLGVTLDIGTHPVVPGWYLAGLLGLFVAACCFVVVRTASPETRQFMWRGAGASLTAIVVYFGAGVILLAALSGFGE
jgi:hypothetical protein